MNEIIMVIGRIIFYRHPVHCRNVMIGTDEDDDVDEKNVDDDVSDGGSGDDDKCIDDDNDEASFPHCNRQLLGSTTRFIHHERPPLVPQHQLPTSVRPQQVPHEPRVLFRLALCFFIYSSAVRPNFNAPGSNRGEEVDAGLSR